ncbi:MAG: hypothetical protein KGO05_15765, partial [Chloroflexota bacterium]|nr:hypothetical protein [Chloroflexota bacterium]
RAAPVTRDLRANARQRRLHALLGDARVAIVAALIVALVSVTLLQISPLALRSKAPGVTSGVQFTPTPGVTVTIQATPSQTAPATSQTPGASHSGGAGNGGTTPVPPGYPTPATTMGGSPTTTTSAGPDKATLVSYTPTGLDSTSYSWTQVSVTLLNSGVTTWDSSQGYKFQCYQYCWSGWYSSTTSFLVAPGQTYTFVGNMLPAPNSLYYRVDNSVWRMSSPTAGGFGDAAVVTVVEHGWDQSTVFAESSPSCQSDGSSWSQQGATGTATCGGSGLALAQGGTGGVFMALTSTPSGYNYTQYMVKVHVHFTTTSAYTYAGVVLSMASVASNGAQTVFMVSPAGYYC